jgi:hypothetical protein
VGDERAGELTAVLVRSHVESAGVVAEELITQRAAPQIDAGFNGDVGPAAGGLGAMVAPAGGGEVAAAGRAAVVSVGIMGDAVLAVALFGGRKQNGNAQIRSRSWSGA